MHESKEQLERTVQELKAPEQSQKRSEEKAAVRPLDMLCPSQDVLEGALTGGMRLLFSAPENVEYHQQEGYDVVPDKKGGPVKSREMVLMRIPEATAQAFERAVADATKAQSESIAERMRDHRDQMEASLRRAGYTQRQIADFRRNFEIDIERGAD